MAEVKIDINARDNASKVIKQVDKSFTDFGKTTKSVQGILSGYDKAAAGLAIFAGTMKKAFDLGKEGAMVIQTAQSFDYLIQKVGGSTELLKELQAASAGTISDMELMSSTTALLSGTQGELATALVNATPQLLEMAKAASKLNPALGDTAFLYQSLALGIKRGSPMILDNLGITVRIEEANKKFADSIGKTVEQLTSEEIKMALLNATMEAGGILIEQAGGKADSAVDAFTRLDASTKNLSDNLKAALVPILADAAGALELLVTWSDRTDAAIEEQRKQVYKTSDSYSEYIDQIYGLTDVERQWVKEYYSDTERFKDRRDVILALITDTGIMSEELFKASKIEETYADEAERAANMMLYLSSSMEHAKAPSEELTQITQDQITALEDFRLAALGGGAAVDRIAVAAGKSSAGIQILADTISASFGQELVNEMDTITREMAGQLELQTLAAGVADALRDGEITPEQAKAFFAALYVEQQELEASINAITADEAAANISNTLGVSIEESKKMMDGVVDGLNALRNVSMNWTIRVNYVEGYRGPDLNFLPEPQQNPTWQQPIPEASGGMVTKNHPYLVGERGPELFIPFSSGQIVPNNQINGMGAVNIVFESGSIMAGNANADELVNLISSKLAAQLTSAINSGAGYTGAA